MVDLGGASIGGTLDCSDGRFDGDGDEALNGNALRVGADALLNKGFQAKGTVDLNGATVGGQLACSGGRFDGDGQMALIGDALTVGADVFLRPDDEQRDCHVSGPMAFVGARIGGELQVSGARLDGPIDLESVRIEGGLFLRDFKGEVPQIDLTEARVGVLRDNAAAWEAVGRWDLAGFRYESLEGEFSIRDRIRWLQYKTEKPVLPRIGEPIEHQGLKFRLAPTWFKGVYEDDFDPQPYSQLAEVLNRHGNRNGGARVLAEREHRLRIAVRRRANAHLDGSVSAGLHSIYVDTRRIWDFLFRWMFGYGYLPARALIWALVIVLAAAWLYGTVYERGQMAPNSDVVLTSSDWLKAVEQGCAVGQAPPGCEMPLTLWAGDAARGIAAMPSAVDYETFSPLLYGLDLFVPLDALGQETTWAPSWERGGWGKVGYSMRWFFQTLGWVITALGAAVLTGLLGRKD